MSDLFSGTTVAASALTGVSLFGLMSSSDYGVIFGAFAGAVFYVATAAELSLWRRALYFLVSFIVGIYGAGLIGAKLASLTHYNDKPLDALGAVLLSALAIKILTFVFEQDLAAWLRRWTGGDRDHK
ncbi:Membrane protein [Paramixta manurensis]|uniref:Membrane protein n=1 Tax=Paramixta manurensis TaxID=2740817 RepID=A0A6M8U7H9_9GAMM|nr:Membrane protein [Erwiniaceae bacterium PD-1]